MGMPWFAVLAGLIIGVSLFVPLAWSSRLPTQWKADIGLFVVASAAVGGLIVALSLVLGYRFIAPAASAYFGLALAGAYLSVVGVYTAVSIKRFAGPGNDLPNETRR